MNNVMHKEIWDYLISKEADPDEWEIVYEYIGTVYATNGLDCIRFETASQFKQQYEERYGS